MTNNASSTIAGLKRVTSDYVDYLSERGDTAAVRKWTAFGNVIPDIPFRTVDGKEMISPAKTWERVNNIETPSSIRFSPGECMV